MSNALCERGLNRWIAAGRATRLVATVRDAVEREARWIVGFTVLGLLSVFLLAGWMVGRLSLSWGQTARIHERVHMVDLSFGQGFLDGSRLGRTLGDGSPGPMSGDDMARAVSGSLEGQGDALSVRGAGYVRGFHEGAHAGLRQRMLERFGAQSSPFTPAPAVRKVLVVRKADGRLEPSTPATGVRCLVHPDGSIEYTNM